MPSFMARASLALLACLASATSYRLGATPRPHAFASHMDAPRLGPRVPTTARMDEARSPRTSVYQTLSDEQIDNIHKVADAAFNVIDRNGDESVTKEELAAHLLLALPLQVGVVEGLALVHVGVLAHCSSCVALFVLCPCNAVLLPDVRRERRRRSCW